MVCWPASTGEQLLGSHGVKFWEESLCISTHTHYTEMRTSALQQVAAAATPRRDVRLLPAVFWPRTLPYK